MKQPISLESTLASTKPNVLQEFIQVDVSCKQENQTRTIEPRQGYEDNIFYDLGSNKTVKIGIWQRNEILLINILDFNWDNRGPKRTPNCDYTKGTALTLPQWKAFVKSVHDMDDDVDEIYAK